MMIKEFWIDLKGKEVEVYLISGICLRGVILAKDDTSILLKTSKCTTLCMLANISSIVVQ